jgi:hypothetical protein
MFDLVISIKHLIVNIRQSFYNREIINAVCENMTQSSQGCSCRGLNICRGPNGTEQVTKDDVTQIRGSRICTVAVELQKWVCIQQGFVQEMDVF